MPSFASLSEHAGHVVKAFVYAFGSAPTADLITQGERYLDGGGSARDLLDFLFHQDAPGNPYAGFGVSTDTQFIGQLLDGLCAGTTVSPAKREAWSAYLADMKTGFPDRAQFAIAVAALVEGMDTDDTDLLAVRATLKDRLDVAAAFAGSAAGAVYDGQGFGQLKAVFEPVVPGYQLGANATIVDEGATVVYTIQTTNVAPGTLLAYVFSGAGITAADLSTGALEGVATVGADGRATLSVTMAKDAVTEGLETLRLALVAAPGVHVDVVVRDTSRTPEGGNGTDTFVVADQMNLEGAAVPSSALDGEIRFDSYLTYDLLNQSGRAAVRLSVADLVASGSVAGAAPVTTNQSADRGNLPQVSNHQLLKLDLGEGIDRVDYSAEQGRVVAVVGRAGSTGGQHVMVNDDAVDNRFDGPTDRVDLLTGVEEIVASTGGGVLDLTASGRDWVLHFSDAFSAADVDAAKDRAVHRIVLQDPGASGASATQYLEVRDAGQRGDAAVPTAAWSTIEGSDRNETLLFTDHESLDLREAHLRGGDNALSFGALTRSVAVQVSITPFVASTRLADDRNDSGLLTATTRFTDGHGHALPGSQRNVTTSYTPEHGVAAGSLLITGSLDAEDSIGFEDTAGALRFTLGRSDGSTAVRLLGQTGGDALRLRGFEALHDNAGSADLYSVQNLALALQGPRLVDGGGSNSDTVQVFTEALGHAALGGTGSIDLGVINGPTGFNYHFGTLDISGVVGTGLLVKGTAAAGETLVAGALSSLASVTGFEALRLSDATLAAGTAFVLDLDHAAVRGEGGVSVAYDGRALSAEGSSRAVVMSVLDSSAGAGAMLTGGQGADHLTGGQGNDVLRGGAGDDVLDGGFSDATVSFTLSGTPDATTTATHRILLTLNVAGTLLTLGEAAVADTAYADGHGAVVDGAGRAAIGNALVGLVQAQVAASSAPLSNGLKGASFDEATGVFRLLFAEGSTAAEQVSLALDRGADGGSLAVSAATVVDGSGGSDRFVFEASGALNGTDTILNFGRGDKLDVTAFTGIAITKAAAPIDAALGGVLDGGASTLQFLFGRASPLTAADFAPAAQAGKLVLAEGSRTVIAVSADPTGAHGDAANTPISLYFVHNGPADGLGDLSVSLVGVISGPAELGAAEMFSALSPAA